MHDLAIKIQTIPEANPLASTHSSTVDSRGVAMKSGLGGTKRRKIFLHVPPQFRHFFLGGGPNDLSLYRPKDV